MKLPEINAESKTESLLIDLSNIDSLEKTSANINFELSENTMKSVNL